MPDIKDLTQHGAPPARFVAVSTPGHPSPILWAIIAYCMSRAQGLGYLAQIRSVFADMGPIDVLLAKRLMQ